MDQDLSAFKSLVLQDTTSEERVQVNQRHLIDKILARYSAPFTIYRELLQNANDAGATETKISFLSKTPQTSTQSSTQRVSKESRQPKEEKGNRTTAFEPNSPYHTIHFQNNGRPFQPEDWLRLKKIAEGNPDEQKIGFFGVGFYSLFSICEEPFVVSDQECMAFFWKGDQLYTKRMTVPETQRHRAPWTTVSLDLREPGKLPDIEEFGRFLACSIAFTKNLRSVSLYLDDLLLVKVSKKVSDPNPLSCTHSSGQGLTSAACRSLHTKSPHGIFQLQAVYGLQVQIDAEYLKCTKTSGMFWSSAPKFSRVSSTLFLRIAQGHLSTHVTPVFADQMERTTKKYPPKTTTIQMIYTGLEEYEASISVHEDFPLFRDLLPYPHQGKVFIGFPTHQTTGCSVHLAAHLIPTVERESIDFVDPHLARWNQEMLSMCALLARVLYDEELSEISLRYARLLDNSKPNPSQPQQHSIGSDAALAWLERRCIHAMSSFCFHPATPIKTVGKLMENGFFTSGKLPPSILSSGGVKPCDQVRLPDVELIPFLKKTPYLASRVQKEAAEMLSILEQRFKIRKVDLGDLIQDLSDYAITVEQAVSLLRWWLTFKQTRRQIPIPPQDNQRLLGAITLLCPVPSFSLGKSEIGTKNLAVSSIPVPLEEFQYFLNPKLIHEGLPVPRETLPLELTRHFNQHELHEVFGTWKELRLVTWSEYIVSKHRTELSSSAELSEKIHHILYRPFYQQSPNDRATILSLLENVACIPTQLGQRIPRETYFKNVKLFSDLPIVQFSKFPSGMEKFLGDLGVRTHVNLQLVFDRLDHLNWDFMRLLKYLASVKSQLSDAEMEKLCNTALFPARKISNGVIPKSTLSSSKSDVPREGSANGSQLRYKASDLYAPIDSLTNLGLLVIDWPERWRDSSEEAKFLQRLGLKNAPPLIELLQIAGTAEQPETRMNALKFFVDHFVTHYQHIYHRDEILIPFMPCTSLVPRPLTDRPTTERGNVNDLFVKRVGMAKPSECYTNPASEVMGFQIIPPDLRRDAERFGIPQHPPVSALLSVLLTNPPMNPLYGRWVFEYLASRQADFSSGDWEKLRFLKFIPIERNVSSLEEPSLNSQRSGSSSLPMVFWMSPSDCYFVSDVIDFKYDFFTYIHFGPIANLFLKACGVQEEPSPVDLVRIIMNDPPKFLEACQKKPTKQVSKAGPDLGYEHYLQVLRQLAIQMPLLSRHPDILRSMRKQPFLIAVREKGTHPMSTGSSVNDNPMDVSETSVLEYRLECSGNISLVDDTVLQKTFNPWYAPMETLLETFYEQLGSTWLSKQVTESSRASGTIVNGARSQTLQNLIRERAPLLIYDYQREQSTKVLRSSEWLASKLRVLEVDQIHIHRKFLPTQQVHTQTTTACLERGLKGMDAPRDTWFLLISRQEYNEFDIATCLCKLLFSKSRLNDALLLETLLSTSLQHLKRKGFPVDRILNSKKVITPVRPAEPPNPSSSHRPQSTLKESRNHETPPPYELTDQSKANQLPAHLLPFFHQLQAMFPDCEPNYLKSCLLEEKHDHVTRVSNRLLDQTYPRLPATIGNGERAVVDSKKHGTQPQSAVPSPSQAQSSNQEHDSSELIENQDHGKFGLIDRLSRRFQNGINDWYKNHDKSKSSTKQAPYTSDIEGDIQPIPGGFPSAIEPPSNTARPTNTVTSNHTALLLRSLQSSVDSCVRNTGVFDGQEQEAPPPPKDFTGESHQNYCSVIPPQKLTGCARLGQFDFYLETGLSSEILFSCDLNSRMFSLLPFDRLNLPISTPDGRQLPPGSNLHALHLMGHTLVALVQVFRLNAQSVHIYYDTDGPAIAFNRGRSLFFNLRYFILLHHPQLALTSERAVDVYFYWFMVVCHELAHNFVSGHNAQHEFYLSSFAEQYLRPLMVTLMKLGKVVAIDSASS